MCADVPGMVSDGARIFFRLNFFPVFFFFFFAL